MDMEQPVNEINNKEMMDQFLQLNQIQIHLKLIFIFLVLSLFLLVFQLIVKKKTYCVHLFPFVTHYLLFNVLSQN
jgi:cell division protein FtsB